MQHDVTTPPAGPDDRPHVDPADRLVDMANQIASFFASYPHDDAVAGVASHINQFWDPRMRRRFLAAAEARRGELHALVADALGAVKG